MALSLKETIMVSFSDFWSRKLRSGITIFSIILGTLTIVAVQSMVRGVKESTLEWMMERGGLTRIDIRRNWEYHNPKNLRSYLTLSEFNLLRRRIPEAQSISPQIRSHGRINRRDNSFWGTISGVLPDFVEVENWQISSGRFINHFDIKNNMDVIVIGSTVSEELFGNANPIGELITFQERRFKVIGVMERRFYAMQGGVMSSNMLEYLNRSAYLPISTMILKLPVEDRIESLSVNAVSTDDARGLRDEIESTLLSLRNNEPVFSVVSAFEQAEESGQATKVFGIVLFVISMISLLVAGIVIMNIMMASIKERTREIGIRMAVGASRMDIFLQFMIQTLLFTFIGGAVGVVLGLSVLDKFSDYIGVHLSGGFGLIIMALSVSLLVGVVFGILPAIKAGNLDPVKCLTYE